LDFGSAKDQSGSRKKLTVLGTTIGSPYYMAPEQAQGLDTIDARADVFALAALTYECVTGEVPFAGNNGPSILLAIMTKDPDPPSTKSRTPKYPIPPALDNVMEEALAKNPAIRTKSVGQLAEAVGLAYGLSGGHRQWAVTPQQELARQIAEARPRTMAAKVAPLAIAADPFAAPAQVAPTLPMAEVPPAPIRQAMDQAFAAVREEEFSQGVPGVPSGKPAWILPLAVGVLALVVGGAVTLVVMMR
jgi:serine/threonine-protein kinase